MVSMNWPPEVRARAVELYTEHGPRQAARLLAAEGHPVPWGTVASWAKRGATPTRTHANTEQATAKVRVTMAQRRAVLADRMLAEAEACMDEMHRPAVMHHWRADGTFDEKKLARPTFGDRKSLATIAAILVDKSQLLAGEATGRVEGLLPAEPSKLRDEALAKVGQLRSVS